MSTKVKINEQGLAQLERQIQTKTERTMQSVAARDAGNQQPATVLKHLHDALAAEGFTPNDDALQTYADLIAKGQPLI